MVLLTIQQQAQVVQVAGLEVEPSLDQELQDKATLAVQILTPQEEAEAVAVLVLLVRLQPQVQAAQEAQAHLTPFLALL